MAVQITIRNVSEDNAGFSRRAETSVHATVRIASFLLGPHPPARRHQVEVSRPLATLDADKKYDRR